MLFERVHKIFKKVSQKRIIKDEHIFEVFGILVYRFLYHRVDPHYLVAHAGINFRVPRNV